MPSDLMLEAKSTAVVIIDLQQGIMARQTAPRPPTDVLAASVGLADRFRAAGSPVVFVRVDLSSIVRVSVDQPAMDPSAPPPPAGASELVEDLRRQPEDLAITKRFYDAFVGTDLEKHLRAKGIKTILLGGISTNAGVESTARTAAALGFDVVLVEDATASSMGAEAHEFAIAKIFPRIARVRKASQVRPA